MRKWWECYLLHLSSACTVCLYLLLVTLFGYHTLGYGPAVVALQICLFIPLCELYARYLGRRTVDLLPPGFAYFSTLILVNAFLIYMIYCLARFYFYLETTDLLSEMTVALEAAENSDFDSLPGLEEYSWLISLLSAAFFFAASTWLGGVSNLFFDTIELIVFYGVLYHVLMFLMIVTLEWRRVHHGMKF